MSVNPRELFRFIRAKGLLALALLFVLPLRAAEPLTIPLANRSEVLVVREPRATTAFVAQPEAVAEMFDKGLLAFANAPTAKEAWGTLIAPTDIVGIKVHAAAGATSGTRPAVVEALIRSLITSGHPATNIIIWDRRLTELRLAGYSRLASKLGVQITSALDEGYDPEVFYEHRIFGKPIWGDLEFGKEGPEIGRKSYVTKLLTKRVTKIINVPPLLNHNVAGVAGNLFTLAMASVDNNLRFQNNIDLLATTVPEIYALPEVGDKVVLNIVDALVAQYQGEETIALHYAKPLNELRFSKDPVALDLLSIHELNRQRETYGVPIPKPPFHLFENASLLELGNTDVRKIQLELIGPAARDQSSAMVTNKPASGS